MKKLHIRYFIIFLLAFFYQQFLLGQSTIGIFTDQKHQVIDGFGAFQSGEMVNQTWWQDLFFEDMEASIYRVDLTPVLVSPHSDLTVYSPWFMGSSVNSVFNLEDPDNPDGPEGNRVRTYTGPEDYSRDFGNENAPIAVMGPNIEDNISYFSYSPNEAIETGKAKIDDLGDFKLIGSIWSPLPWVKISSGNNYNQNWWPGPVQNTPWPFVWGGNFAGGSLDVSGELLEVFDDSALGGDGPTSSLTQFARSTAAYVKGFQDYHQTQFYAISIQNELNFEEYYNSATYPLSSQYIAALKAVRAEFDKHESLKDIRIMGPEDLLGDSYGLWQYGGNNDPTHKNLQYLQNIAADPEAEEAIDFFCIHGYDTDGVSAGDANPSYWEAWKNGWTTSPAEGIPANVKGYSFYGKKSWMTETSGEVSEWLSPSTGFPGFGGWSVGLRIHQALAVGDQSAWIYWTFIDENDNGSVSNFGLTNQILGSQAPKYAAAKHFFKLIRPNSVRVSTLEEESTSILSSAYLNETNNTLTVVLLNPTIEVEITTLKLYPYQTLTTVADSYVSSDEVIWKPEDVMIENGISNSLFLPAFSIMTIQIKLPNEPVSIEDETSNDQHKLEIYPNPADQQIQIRMNMDYSSAVSLSLLNLKGETLEVILAEKLESGEHTFQFSTQDLSNGLYVIQFQNENEIVSKKIVVNHTK